MPRGEFSPWDAFWSVVDALGRPAARGLRGLWLHTVNAVSILVQGAALLIVGAAFMIWDVLQPLLKLGLFAFVIAVVLEGLGVIDVSSHIHQQPEPETFTYAGESPSGNTGGGEYKPWALVLAALGGAFGLVVAAAALVAVKDQMHKRKAGSGKESGNVTEIKNPRRRGK